MNTHKSMIIIFMLFGSTLFAQENPAAEPVLWASNCLIKVLRPDMPGLKTPSMLRVSGARGEIVSGQVVYSPGGTVEGASVRISDLRHALTGNTIPSSAIKVQWERYIDINKNSDRFDGIPDDELAAKAPNSIPDPFYEGASIPIRFGLQKLSNSEVSIPFNANPVWIEIHVPVNADAGDYTGTMTVSGGAKPVSLPVVLHVWNFEMPEERHLAMINWWDFPGGNFKNIKPYSADYWDLLGRFCDFVVEYRQTIAGFADIDIIEERGTAASGYSYDTRNLEKYAEVAFAHGIRQLQISPVGKMTGKNNLDPKCEIVPDEGKFRRLAALEKVIVSRGWKGRFLVSVSDEPVIHLERSFASVVDRVHETAPSVRTLEAVQAEYLGKLDIYCPVLGLIDHMFPRFQQLQSEGAEVWFYTCCEPVGRYPNRFLDQSLLKVRVLHWINYLYDLKGYLHWALNRWSDDDPFTQYGMSGPTLPLGDEAIAYPGKNGLSGSLRFSAQRDGIQDFEYLWVLEHEYRSIKERLGEKETVWLQPRQRSLELCRRVIRSFNDYTRDPDILLDTRCAIAEEIESLRTEPLLVVQTSPSEGTVIHGDPRCIAIRGLVTPGSRITIYGNAVPNHSTGLKDIPVGEPVENIGPDGYFSVRWCLQDDEPVITIKAEHEGKTKTVTRTFKLVD
jgi:hypothetical protein